VKSAWKLNVVLQIEDGRVSRLCFSALPNEEAEEEEEEEEEEEARAPTISPGLAETVV
jgi:hypothetical protein